MKDYFNRLILMKFRKPSIVGGHNPIKMAWLESCFTRKMYSLMKIQVTQTAKINSSNKFIFFILSFVFVITVYRWQSAVFANGVAFDYNVLLDLFVKINSVRLHI